MSLGTNISRLRAEKRLSQGDLAEVLEVSRQSVSKWETDSSVPDLNRLMKLSQLFGVTLDELVTGAEPPVKVETPPVMVSPSMPGRKIAGIILFCMAFLAFLIPTGLGGILIGLILAAGLDGIEHSLPLPEAVNRNLFHPSAAAGLDSLPRTLREAITVAGQSEFISRELPVALMNKYFEYQTQLCHDAEGAPDTESWERAHSFLII